VFRFGPLAFFLSPDLAPDVKKQQKEKKTRRHQDQMQERGDDDDMMMVQSPAPWGSEGDMGKASNVFFEPDEQTTPRTPPIDRPESTVPIQT
jgi:hypothetical protein